MGERGRERESERERGKDKDTNKDRDTDRQTGTKVKSQGESLRDREGQADDASGQAHKPWDGNVSFIFIIQPNTLIPNDATVHHLPWSVQR